MYAFIRNEMREGRLHTDQLEKEDEQPTEAIFLCLEPTTSNMNFVKFMQSVVFTDP